MSGTFRECINLTTITIPYSIKKIGGIAFSGCIGLTTIKCEAIIPPIIEGRVFKGIKNSIPLYVPSASIDLYKAAEQWKDFNVKRL